MDVVTGDGAKGDGARDAPGPKVERPPGEAEV